MTEPSAAGTPEGEPSGTAEPSAGGARENAPANAEEAETDPGALLKQARERSGASVAEIAASKRLDETLVEALEEGRYDAFPAPAYVYGYLRAYAREVGLDGDTLVRRLSAAEHEPSKRLEWLQPIKPPLADRAQRSLGLLFGGVVAAVLITAAVVLWTLARTSDWPFPATEDAASETPAGDDLPAVADALSPQPQAPADVRPVANAQPVADSQPPAPLTPTPDSGAVAEPEPATEPAGFVEVDAEAAPAEPSASLIPDPGASEPSDAQPSEPQLDGESTEFGAAQILPTIERLSSLASDQLSLAFDEDSWVEVEDAGGELIHAELGVSGESYVVHGQAPFSIVIGYAPGVRVAFNGDPVALPPHTRQTVARLVVGP